MKNGKDTAVINNRSSIVNYQLICFSLVAFCFFASLSGAEIALQQLDSTNFLLTHWLASSRDVTTQNIPRTPNPNSHLKRQLYRAWISISKGQKDNRSKNELKRIIDQIGTVEFKPKSQTSEPLITLEPVTTTEPDKTLFAAEATEKSEKKEIESKLSYVPVTGRTLQMLRNLSQHPDRLKNPLELAELLFLSGHLKEAVVFYRQALNRWNPDQLSSAQNMPWILFQMGNCLRDDDPPAAMKMYRQLITEYPESPWTDLAKVRDKLIDWYRKDKPRTLIAECRF